MLRADPPPFIPNPWNSIVLEGTFSLAAGQDGFCNISTVVNLLIAQLRANVDTGTWWLFRISCVGLWEITGQELSVTFCDLDDAYNDAGADTYSALAERIDTPARNRWSHLFYRWPRDNRNNVLDNKNHSNRTVLRVKGPLDGSSKVIMHLRIVWRTSYEEVPGRSVDPVSRFSLPQEASPYYETNNDWTDTDDDDEQPSAPASISHIYS